MKDERMCVCVCIHMCVRAGWARKKEHLFLGNSLWLLVFILLGNFAFWEITIL